jgi:hypothetical protein
MIGLLCFALAVLALPFKSKLRLEAENAVLRQQLIVLRRGLHGRVRLGLGRNRSLRSTPCDVGAVTGDLNLKATMPHIAASRRHVDGARRSAKSVFRTGSSGRR